MNSNPYHVLGIPAGSSEEIVREAYLELIRKYDPNLYEDQRARELAEAKRREVNEAYDAITLGNQQEPVQTSGWGYGQPQGQPPQYQQPRQSPYYQTRSGGDSCCQTLSCLCCADSCCECMGGDLCLCC